MSVTTTLAACSQTVSANGPDGAVDPPSALDDAIRYALSFIAQLRDGRAVIGANGDITSLTALASINGGQLAGLRNRIHNGDMRIDQRNEGAAFGSPISFSLDRWAAQQNGAGSITVQRTSASVPSGFSYVATISAPSASASVATDVYQFGQAIEGQNIADFAFGTALAKQITLSFWVKASIAGTFGVSFLSTSANRSYVTTYTVLASNTWEQKTVTINGDLSGTWPTDNSAALSVVFDLGSGANLTTGLPNAWQTGIYRRTSACTQIVAAGAGANLNITGIQLERGATATPFEQRPYALELMLCQRYYEPSRNFLNGRTTGTAHRFFWPYFVQKRAIPTFSLLTTSVGFEEAQVVARGVTSAVLASSGVDVSGGYFEITGTNSNGVPTSGAILQLNTSKIIGASADI